MTLRLAWPMANEAVYCKCGEPKRKFTVMEVLSILQWMMSKTILDRVSKFKSA